MAKYAWIHAAKIALSLHQLKRSGKGVGVHGKTQHPCSSLQGLESKDTKLWHSNSVHPGFMFGAPSLTASESLTVIAIKM